MVFLSLSFKYFTSLTLDPGFQVTGHELTRILDSTNITTGLNGLP